MIKKNIYKDNLIEHHKAAAKDRLYRFLMNDDTVRGCILHGTRMVSEMRANHELGILETLVLGHAYIAAGLISSNLKGTDRIKIQAECSGPIKGYIVESNAYNEVRGYLKAVPVPVDKPLENFDLSHFFGAGLLTVTKYPEDSKNPFTGTVILKYGNIAQDLAYYFAHSEQTPTYFNLSIQFDKEGNITGAGGMFLQAMPGAEYNTIVSLEQLVNSFPSIGQSLTDGMNPVDMVMDNLGEHSPKFISDEIVEFMCHCKKERMTDYLATLPKDDLNDIIKEESFPLEINCHNCNSKYYFEKNEIEEMLNK
ncbi:MAG: Hsp33 family molecular chaperone HslO [Spirochaetes bacterium]|nr:Hsp33 family molecular chaperone HslO [Spirochaetota bacterium]